MIPMIRGNDGQRPDRPVGRQFFAVKQSEMLGHFLVTTHGVGHARARAHAGQCRTDQSEEHREGLNQHERLAAAALPNSQVPTMIIMSPIGAAEPNAFEI